MNCKIPEFFLVGNSDSGKPTNFKAKILSGEKIHAMKLDRMNSYKPGAGIVLCHTYNSKPNIIIREVTVVSTQEVEFRYSVSGMPNVFIDGRRLGMLEIFALAANEGFKTESVFFQVYNKSKKYKLVHWTDYRYDGNAERLQQVNDRHAAVNKM